MIPGWHAGLKKYRRKLFSVKWRWLHCKPQDVLIELLCIWMCDLKLITKNTSVCGLEVFFFILTWVFSSYFEGLAVGLGIGALAEVAKKSLRPEERSGKPFQFLCFLFSLFFILSPDTVYLRFQDLYSFEGWMVKQNNKRIWVVLLFQYNPSSPGSSPISLHHSLTTQTEVRGIFQRMFVPVQFVQLYFSIANPEVESYPCAHSWIVLAILFKLFSETMYFCQYRNFIWACVSENFVSGCSLFEIKGCSA